MAEHFERVAIIAVHGVADQQPGQTVGELARLLCHGASDRARYVEGEKHEIILPVRRLPTDAESRSIADASTRSEPVKDARVGPGSPSSFFLAHESGQIDVSARASDDLGVMLTDYMLSRYRPHERDALYESTRISLRRKADDTPIDMYELYWADYSRLRPGVVRVVSAIYQLFFHLNTLARDVVDQVALATGRTRASRTLQSLHAWSAWLLKGPVALLQLAVLLMIVVGAAAFVPEEDHAIMLQFGGGVAAVVIAIVASGAALRNDGPAMRVRSILPWVLGVVGCAAIAAASVTLLEYSLELYFFTAVLLPLLFGALLMRRYSQNVQGVRVVGWVTLAFTAALVSINAEKTRTDATTFFEWMMTTVLNTGEYLLAALLLAWAILAMVVMAALLLGFVLALRGDARVAASLATARISMVVSTALFAIVSLVLWAATINVFNDKLEDFLYLPVLFGRGYRSVAIFVDQQVTNIDLLFTPVMAVVGAFGGVAMVALAPSLREELAPSDHSLTPVWAARLGMWMNGARRCLGYMFGAIGPAVAMIFGAVYLLFVSWMFFGSEDQAVDWLGALGVGLLGTMGQLLAGGAVTIGALGARFTKTFGKLRVGLDAALDVDNYFQDPADHLPPRARIFSRYSSLLANVCSRGYSRVVIVSHSQGTVITADLLRYLGLTGRLRDYAGATPLSLVTVGSPLRDLYAALFPFLYPWMGVPSTSFATSGPTTSDLSLAQWANAYRSGDYVGRSIWTAPTEALMFRVATVSADGEVLASRDGSRTEFCLGAGAHTHYFSNDAIALAVEIDRLVSGRPTKQDETASVVSARLSRRPND